MELAENRMQKPATAGTGDSGGILIVDKPEGITSAGVAARIKRLLRPRKIGHTGTLDPFATGVLVICLNEATRAADQFLNLNKVYTATVRFGVETDTLDGTGRVVRVSDARFTEAALLDTIDSFRGRCIQKAPRFSAVKVGGHRLYELSRKGIDVDRPEREVCIHSIALQSFAWPEAVLEVSCSKGTYIRQLAADIGERLESGAHVSTLRRTSVGPFHVDSALGLEELATAAEEKRIAETILPVNDALAFLPSICARDDVILRRLRNGQMDPEWESAHAGAFATYAGAVRIVTESDRLAALWWPNPVQTGARRLRIFPF